MCERVLLFVVLSLAAVMATMAAGGRCGAWREARVTGRLWSNASGHWTASARVEDSAHAHAQRPALEMEATPAVRRCEGLNVRSLTLTVRGEPLTPSPGYDKTVWEGSYYKVHEEKVDWWEAKKICEEENAHLLVLNSEAEAAAIKLLVAKYPNITPWIYVGFTDIDREGQYVTIFGQTLAEAGYSNWSPGEPSVMVKIDNIDKEEDCGSVSASEIRLNDIICTLKKFNFICEQPS